MQILWATTIPHDTSKIKAKKLIPLKSMFYLPLVPRLQRMFASMQTTQHMTWHDENKTQGMLRHPSNGETLKHFDRKHPSFAIDPVTFDLVYVQTDLICTFKHRHPPILVGLWLLLHIIFDLRCVWLSLICF